MKINKYKNQTKLHAILPSPAGSFAVHTGDHLGRCTVLWQKDKIYWPVFQQADVVFIRASIGGFRGGAEGAAARSSFLVF